MSVLILNYNMGMLHALGGFAIVGMTELLLKEQKQNHLTTSVIIIAISIICISALGINKKLSLKEFPKVVPASMVWTITLVASIIVGRKEKELAANNTLLQEKVDKQISVLNETSPMWDEKITEIKTQLDQIATKQLGQITTQLDQIATKQLGQQITEITKYLHPPIQINFSTANLHFAVTACGADTNNLTLPSNINIPDATQHKLQSTCFHSHNPPLVSIESLICPGKKVIEKGQLPEDYFCHTPSDDADNTDFHYHYGFKIRWGEDELHSQEGDQLIKQALASLPDSHFSFIAVDERRFTLSQSSASEVSNFVSSSVSSWRLPKLCELPLMMKTEKRKLTMMKEGCCFIIHETLQVDSDQPPYFLKAVVLPPADSTSNDATASSMSGRGEIQIKILQKDIGEEKILLTFVNRRDVDPVLKKEFPFLSYAFTE